MGLGLGLRLGVKTGIAFGDGKGSLGQRFRLGVYSDEGNLKIVECATPVPDSRATCRRCKNPNHLTGNRGGFIAYRVVRSCYGL